MLAGHPLDNMKMRMQTHQYTSLKTAVGDTLRHEGILGFYRGMGPPLVTTAALKSVAFTVNEAFKNQLVRGRLDPTPTIVDNFIGGFLSGFLVASIEFVEDSLSAIYLVDAYLTHYIIRKALQRLFLINKIFEAGKHRLQYRYEFTAANRHSQCVANYPFIIFCEDGWSQLMHFLKLIRRMYNGNVPLFYSFLATNIAGQVFLLQEKNLFKFFGMTGCSDA